MSSSMSSQIPRALPFLSPSSLSTRTNPSLSISCRQRHPQIFNSNQTPRCLSQQATHFLSHNKSSLAIQVGALLSIVAEPANALTGINNEEDFTWVLTQLGIVLFFYFIVAPPIIMNWLRIRWYRRNLLEMYLQFMFVFIFFPGVLVWAPFVNFRRFPRDPSMKDPWSTPKDPSLIKNTYRKYPWAEPEDYDV